MIKIGGFQKLTLQDFPGRVAAMVFTQGCNFRCPYCHNPELLDFYRPAAFDASDVLRHLYQRRFFLDGVVITGGEPTIHGGLPEFIREIKAMGLSVKLDTNGSNPAMVQTLLLNHLLDYVALDVKAGSEDNYDLITGTVDRYWDMLTTMAYVLNAGIEYEWRTTVYPPINDAEDLELIRRLIGKNSWTIQQISDHKKAKSLHVG